MAAIVFLSPMAFVPITPMVARPAAMASPPVMMAATDWKKPAMSVFLALALTFSPMDAAEAGRSGGRVGGRAPSMSSRPMARPSSGATARPAMRTSAPAPAPMQRTTNVYMAPMGGGMYGGGMYGGGMMGGGNGLGLYLGLSVAGTACDSNTKQPVTTLAAAHTRPSSPRRPPPPAILLRAESFMREQQRQAYLQQQLRTQQQLGQDQAAIQQLQNELNQQNLKVDAMKQQGAESNTGAATEKDIEALKLRLQLMEQEKEIAQLKALSAPAVAPALVAN
jgi:hypothetical protein